MSYITTAEILAQTDDGLEIICYFYPEARKASENKNYKFSIRDEKTPSATLYRGEKDNQWRVNDFGDKQYSPFDLVMREKNCDFRAALRFIEVQFNIQGAGKPAKPASAVYSCPEAPLDSVMGSRSWVVKEKPTVADCKHIFSKNTWDYMGKYNEEGKKINRIATESPDETALKRALIIFDRYNFNFLEKNMIVGKDKRTGKTVVHTFESTNEYPICMYNEGKWQKFYEPYSQTHRFSSAGEKPKDYMFGWEFITRMIDEGSNDKFDEIIICTGGSDALNVAALGFIPVWFNSETVRPDSIPVDDLKKKAWKVYNLPDIDITGITKAKELAIYHLDVHTIFLPDELKRLKSGKYAEDGSPKYCKDIKDYFNKYGATDFRNLLKNAYPLRFWTESLAVNTKGEPKIVDGKEVYKYSPHPVLTLNFLNKNGFGQLVSGGGEVKNFVKVSGNIVSKTDSGDMKNYIDNFLENRHLAWDLRNAFLRSKDVSEGTLERLPRLPLDFSDHDREVQVMFFQNEIWEIRKDGIKSIAANKSDRFVWEHEVIKPKIWDNDTRTEKVVEVKLLPEDIFKLTKADDGVMDIEILDVNCPFLNFLINTSRVHWRKELEDRLDKKEDKAAYREEHRFRLDGKLLDAEEIWEQKQHLIAKICAMGYLLHRYKDEANTYAIWSMDAVMRDSEKSQGGTGKSLFGKSLFYLMQYLVLDGRDRNLTQNKHIFENVTEHTDYMLLDDGAKYLDFNFFFSSVTTFMKVNPKGTKGFDLMFKDTPKLHVSSNFPPLEADDSTLRRLWFLAFSDYYHYNASGEYREQRLPKDDFGKNLFQNFDAEEWNSFLNFAALCVKAYMNHGKVEPPMHELMVNTFKNKLGPNFMQWANFYFQPDNETLDCYVHRRKMFETYKMEVSADITPNGFRDKIALYCRMKHWELNPKEVKHIQSDGRISKKVSYQPQFDNRTKNWILLQLPKSKSEEFFYIRTEDKDLTLNGLEEYDGVERLVNLPEVVVAVDNLGF